MAAQAVTFPDVSKNAPYYDAVNALSDMGVVTGNPDGTFHPKNAINRAALLKMLYKAAGKNTDGASTNCFPKEFGSDSWFAPYVCDAVARGYVKGYIDGSFKANNTVTLAEAMKMTFSVLGLSVSPQAELASVYSSKWETGSWYASYLASAAYKGILPLPGSSLTDLNPNDPIDRGQAAMIVHAAWKLAGSSVSSSSAASVSSAGSSGTKQSSSAKAADIKQVTFPFTDEWVFSAKEPLSYHFKVTTATLADISVKLKDVSEGSVSCRLFRLQSDGFSFEYYLGYEQDQQCFLLNMLAPGEYQLQLQPTVNNASYSVSAKTGKGDGNDGVSQAKLLTLGKMRTETMAPLNLEDWYTFTVKPGKEETQRLLVETTSTEVVECLIYPWSDVDLYGFSGPACNQVYDYPAGTYYVRIGHGKTREKRQTYSVTVKSSK
jgi:hypothetical protein